MINLIQSIIKRLNTHQIISVILVLFGFGLAVFYFDNVSNKEFGWTILVMAILSSTVGLFGVFVDLLRPEAKIEYGTDEIDDDGDIFEKINVISQKLDGLTQVSINVDANTLDARKAIVDAIDCAAVDAIKKAQKRTQPTEQSRNRNLSTTHLNRGRIRLSSEIQKVGKRATTNLIIGSIISIIGIFVIAATAFTLNIDETNLSQEIIRLSPRVALGILVEFFAIFFLKLYKSSFDEMRYYHNEITNIDFRASALIAAIGFGGEESVRSVVGKMADMERNFLIDKGKSTIELRKMEIDADEENKYRALVKSMIDNIPKFK